MVPCAPQSRWVRLSGIDPHEAGSGRMGTAVVLGAADVEHIATIAFIDIAIIVVVARLMGALFRRMGQPAVVGEIIAGIALGPSLLGALPGDLTEELFPSDVRPFLAVIAQLGLVLFMFIVGLELDPQLVRGKERVAAIISLTSVALPFATGIAAAALLFDAHDIVDGEEVSFVAFALFLGASMSVTAFPVLARILTERGMHRTQLGVIVLACAAVDDVLAWSLLAVVVAVAGAADVIDIPLVIIESVAYVAVMFLVVRPQLVRLADRYRQRGELTADMVAVVLVGILVSSWTTSIIGIHAIFGAFVFGVVMPRDATVELFHDLLVRIEQIVVLLLLPVFFIVTGLTVDIRGLGVANIGELALIVCVACFGKFVGATAAARALGMRTRRAASIGILMNTRGLTELVILTIGLDNDILDEQLFTMLVIMAILTTVVTTPLLRRVYPDRLVARDVAEAEGAADDDVTRAVVNVSDADQGQLVRVGAALLGDDRPGEVVILRLLPRLGGTPTDSLGIDLLGMTRAMEELRVLGDGLELDGVGIGVRAQFVDDVAEGLRAQLESTAPVIAVVGRGNPVGDLIDPPCLLAVVDDEVPIGDAGLPIVAVVDGPGPVEVAMRAAIANESRLVLVPGEARRAARWSASLATLAIVAGVDCIVVDTLPPEGLVVAGTRRTGTHIVVTTPRDHPTDSVEHLLERRIEARRRPATGSDGPPTPAGSESR